MNFKIRKLKIIDLKTKVILTVFCIGVIAFSSAQAQKNSERKEPPTFTKLLEKMDANQDGKLAKEEVKGPLEKNFAKIDTDEDGFISEAEFDKAPKPERRQNKRN